MELLHKIYGKPLLVLHKKTTFYQKWVATKFMASVRLFTLCIHDFEIWKTIPLRSIV